jgi:hypothetical protein
VPNVANEPNVSRAGCPQTLTDQHHYAKGSKQRRDLAAALDRLQAKLPVDVPLMIGAQEVRFRLMDR